MPLLTVLAVAVSSPAPLGAQEPPPPPQFPEAPFPALAPPVEAVRLGSPVLATEEGPLFSLRRVVARLGGELIEADESVTLVLGEEAAIAGPGNPVAIVDREIVELSQAPIQGETEAEGLLVPVDFLRASYGELQDYDFEWSADERLLTARRRLPATLPVEVDVVHLQGVTTVVLRFPRRLDYEVVERDDAVEVRPRRDRFVRSDPGAPAAQRVSDPLVEEVRVAADRVRIELAPGTAAESYVLERPYRLVFDVVREESPRAEAPEAPSVERPRPDEGIRTIVLDPGHGGSETGAVGPSGEAEKDLTLEIARSLRRRLVERLPVRVVLTRDQDEELPLDARSAVANQNKADLFVSIHVNSSLGAGARGAETYFLSMEASDARAAEVAAAENREGRPAGAGEDPLYDLQLILWDLAQSYHLAASQRVATLIQEELDGALGLRDRGVKQAPFRVLMGAAMPAVLVEVGFLSNPEEEARLQDPAYRADLVDALVRAIGRYRAEVEERAAGGAETAAPAEGPAEPTP